MSSNPQTGEVFAGNSVEQLRNLTTYLYYGPNPDQVLGYPLFSLDEFFQYQCIVAIHSSVRIASACVICLLLFLISQRYKSLLFVLYQSNFLLMMVGGSLELGWVLSYNGSLTQFMTTASPDHTGYNVSMAASVFQTVLMLTLLATLVVQIYVSFSDQKRQYQLGVTGLAVLGCFPSYLICIWRLVIVGISLYSSSAPTTNGYGLTFFANDIVKGDGYVWVVEGAWGAFAASCAFCSIILCIKLYFVSRTRAKMGLVKFDALRILFTMALQNSVIPSILAIVSAAINPNNLGGKCVEASAIPICACMLPMGFIWAQYKSSHPTLPSVNLHEHNRRMAKGKVIRDDYSDHTVSGNFADSPIEKSEPRSLASSVRALP